MFIKVKNASYYTIIVVLLINVSIGAWSISEILSWFGKSIPIMASIIIGLFAGEISIPIAIVGWVLKICGIF
ncbi:hypothetical protein [uncultured Clostridium sp.]|uniref:hypothetical protein n=1 Tax=uncultured Clostridium sp. TaxID=59620 RepID=UPI00262D04B4|nr:hypothetical protein [uncultured Clostridium sp.]